MTIAETIAMLDEYYNRNKPLSENVVRLYCDSLKDLDPSLLERVAMAWAQEGKPFMPKIAELRAEVGKIHVDRFIDKRRVVREEKDYFVTEDFIVNENGRFRVTYRALKPREFDTVIAQ